MRVLIVDDCELSAGMLVVVLEIYGHEVRLTRSPGAAIRVAADFQPEFVLLAASTPLTTSESDAAEHLRTLADGEVQIFALCHAPGELSSCEQCLFDHVFPRPVRFGQLKPFLDAAAGMPRTVGRRVQRA